MNLITDLINKGCKLTGSRMYNPSSTREGRDWDFIAPESLRKEFIAFLDEQKVTYRATGFGNGVHIEGEWMVDIIFLTPFTYKAWVQAEQVLMTVPEHARTRELFHNLLKYVYCPELFTLFSQPLKSSSDPKEEEHISEDIPY